MCLAVPGRIIEISERADDPAAGRVARVDFQGSCVDASLVMTPEAAEGDWVLVHAGFALTVVDAAEARRTWQGLDEVLGRQGPPQRGRGVPGRE